MKIKIANARLSFPSLFHTADFGGQDTGKYESTFLLNKKDHAELIERIKTGMKKLMDEAKVKVPSDKLCLKDGDETDREEMQGHYSIKASTKRRPLVINRDKSPITEDDNIIYPGCYVNGIITLWVQDNNYGRRINAQLDGVQFVRDGEAFGAEGIGVDAFDDFGTVDADDDEDFGF